MYNDLKQLKKMKGLTDDVKRKIEKAWAWGLITDEQFEELMEIQKESSADAADGAGSDAADGDGSDAADMAGSDAADMAGSDAADSGAVDVPGDAV